MFECLAMVQRCVTQVGGCCICCILKFAAAGFIHGFIIFIPANIIGFIPPLNLTRKIWVHVHGCYIPGVVGSTIQIIAEVFVSDIRLRLEPIGKRTIDTILGLFQCSKQLLKKFGTYSMRLQGIGMHPLFMSTRNCDRLGIGIFKTEETSLNTDNIDSNE